MFWGLLASIEMEALFTETVAYLLHAPYEVLSKHSHVLLLESLEPLLQVCFNAVFSFDDFVF